MAHLRALTTPASAPGGFAWDDDRSVVEVPDSLAEELLRIGQFAEVLPGDEQHPGTRRTARKTPISE